MARVVGQTVGQTNVDKPRRTSEDEPTRKPVVTCTDTDDGGWRRTGSSTHNPKVAGSNPAPATNEIPGSSRRR